MRESGRKWLMVDSYMEAVYVLYAKNSSTFTRIGSLVSHLLNISPRRIPVMRDVRWKWAPLLSVIMQK